MCQFIVSIVLVERRGFAVVLRVISPSNLSCGRARHGGQLTFASSCFVAFMKVSNILTSSGLPSNAYASACVRDFMSVPAHACECAH